MTTITKEERAKWLEQLSEKFVVEHPGSTAFMLTRLSNALEAAEARAEKAEEEAEELERSIEERDLWDREMLATFAKHFPEQYEHMFGGADAGDLYTPGDFEEHFVKPVADRVKRAEAERDALLDVLDATACPYWHLPDRQFKVEGKIPSWCSVRDVESGIACDGKSYDCWNAWAGERAAREKKA